MMRPLLTLLAALLLSQTLAHAQTSFTYQGRLTTGGQPAQGSHDVEFRLFDAATNGNQVGSTLTENGLTVTDGVFSAVLDFGDGPFNSAPRWIQVDVRASGGGAFTTLLPRLQIGAAPFAIESQFVAPGAIDTAALQDNSVTTGKIANGNVFTDDLANFAVGTGKLSNQAVTRLKISDDAIGTSQIEDGTVSSTDIRDGTITAADISGGVLLSDKTVYYTSQGTADTVQPSSSRLVTAQCHDNNDIPIAFHCEVITTVHDVLMRDTVIANWSDNSAPASATCSFSNRHPNVGADIRASIVCLAKP